MAENTVLVVEDEPIVALNLQQKLMRLGYSVPAIVSTGEEALSKIDELRPDLVLMDINIEGPMDGIETATRIPAEFNLPVIYLTAYSEEATLERARATKPYGYLLKPFSERELHATLQMVLERRKTVLQLHDSEERLRLALDAAAMGSWELDVESRKLLRIGTTDAIFGISSGVISVTWDVLMSQVLPEDRAEVVAVLEKAIVEESSCEIEFRSRLENGALRWLKIQGKVHHLHYENSGRRIIGVVQDISERKRAEQELRRAATVFAASPDGILVLDGALQVLSANQSYYDMTGESPADVIGKQPSQLGGKLLPSRSRDEIFSAVDRVGNWSGELRGVHKSGEHFPMLANIAKVRDDGGDVTNYIVVVSDLTDVRNAEQKLYHLAHHDSLTGLPNRLLARDRMATAIERARRRGWRVAVLFIDLDFFKRVNDTLGHDVGDELLCTVTRRLQDSVRHEDTVARLGGDEFMIMLDRIERLEEVVIVAEKVVASLTSPLQLRAQELSISASIGISLFPDDAGNRDELIRTADIAMYSAKGQGRNRYTFYAEEMTSAAVHYMELDQELRAALKNEEFVLYFQPQITMTDKSLAGVEALIRWQHPSRGLVGPADIIPVAEESGLIIGIGEWVIRRACEQARAWREAGLPPLRISVNVSARQMRQENFVQRVETILLETGMPYGQLEIEITESTLQSEQNCISTLEQLRDMGISLAIDDFGTGYSCFSSLRNLPIDRVKIDRSFVRDTPEDPDDVAIVEAIIAMAHRLHLQVIAEGVETLEQEVLLDACGCEEAQGYLYSKPLPEAELRRGFLTPGATLN